MAKYKSVPCLVRENTGQTKVELERIGGVFTPVWGCPDWTCPLRPEGDSCYETFRIRLGNNKQSTHGVVYCEGVGGIGRRR